MSRGDDYIRIQHIIDAIDEATTFIQGRTKECLYLDRQLSLALIKLLEIIGEAANKVSPEFKSANSHIPWRQMIDMRNRLTHGYFDTDLGIVWKTVNSELPQLLNSLQSLIANNRSF